jgi:hypothetical protein
VEEGRIGKSRQHSDGGSSLTLSSRFKQIPSPTTGAAPKADWPPAGVPCADRNSNHPQAKIAPSVVFSTASYTLSRGLSDEH